MTSSLLRKLAATSAAALAATLVVSATLAVAVSVAPAASSAASTTAAPPWEPDPNSVGGLIFYSSTGQVITGGSTKASPLAAYVQGTSTIAKGDTKAYLFGFTPVEGLPTGGWSGEQLSGTTVYPNKSAPKALASSPLPLVTGSASDEDILDYTEDFPNGSSNPDYTGMYQLRLYTSAPDATHSVTYDSADIRVTGDTWSVVYSLTRTTTSLKASGATVTKGKKLTLTATVSPAEAGSVTFYNGSKKLATEAVSKGKSVYSSTKLAVAKYSFKATFVPSKTNFASRSTSKVVKVTIKK